MWSLTLDVDLRALATCTLYVTYYVNTPSQLLPHFLSFWGSSAFAPRRDIFEGRNSHTQYLRAVVHTVQTRM